jgi:hypothetical protein
MDTYVYPAGPTRYPHDLDVDAAAVWRLMARATPGHDAFDPTIAADVAQAQRHGTMGDIAVMWHWAVEAIMISLLHDGGAIDSTDLQPYIQARRDAEDLLGMYPYGRVPVGRARFPLGRTVIDSDLLRGLDEFDYEGLSVFVDRHLRGDWGEVDDHDAVNNERAVLYGEHITSVYRLPDATRVWVITEADRSATTLLGRDAY